MKILLSAPFHGPRFEGQQLAAVASRRGHVVIPFEHPASRDPTLELPETCRRERPDLVLLVAPAREDPDTLELLRGFGAAVAVWAPPQPATVRSWRLARARWIAAAADFAAATTPELAHDLCDRRGRPAAVVPAGFDAQTLGARSGPIETVDEAVAVRAADDPLLLRPLAGGADGGFLGHGDRKAFPDLPCAGLLRTPKEFGGVVGGRRYIAGGRLGPSPSVFDDALAAAACGARVYEVVVRGALADATPRPSGADAGETGFDARLAAIVQAVIGGGW